MTQQPSQNKQILAKLDTVIENIGTINTKISRIETQIEMQPQIDAESHKAIADRFYRAEDRIKKVEEAQVWAMRLVIGMALSSPIALVMSLIK